jgi:hypothetical protein
VPKVYKIYRYKELSPLGWGGRTQFDFGLKPLLIKSSISLDLLLPLNHALGQSGYYAPEKAASRRAAVLT